MRAIQRVIRQAMGAELLGDSLAIGGRTSELSELGQALR
jgi:hypothetical protein